MMLYRPNSRARVTAPMSGRANSTTPKATDTSPPRMNSARVPAVSPLPNAAKNSKSPPTTAQMPTISTSTIAVGPGPDQGDHPGRQVYQPQEQVPEDRPRATAADSAAGPFYADLVGQDLTRWPWDRARAGMRAD